MFIIFPSTTSNGSYALKVEEVQDIIHCVTQFISLWKNIEEVLQCKSLNCTLGISQKKNCTLGNKEDRHLYNGFYALDLLHQKKKKLECFQDSYQLILWGEFWASSVNLRNVNQLKKKKKSLLDKLHATHL